MPIPTKLRYLFVATFQDGSEIRQAPEDISALNSQRSAFYDVLERVRQGIPVTYFELQDLDGIPRHAVDLRSGLFLSEGRILDIQPCQSPLPPGGRFELIYYRDRSATMTVRGGETVGATDTHRYRIGWNCSIAGQQFTQTLIVD